MAVTITIGGVDRSARVIQSSLLVRLELGAEWSATFDTQDELSTTGAYRPTIDQTVIITNGATTWFAGKIVGVSDSELVSVKGTRVRVECRANLELTLQFKITRTYGAGFSLKQIMVDITNNGPPGDLGIDVNPGMANGPTMGALTFDDVIWAEAVNYLGTLTGWVWRYTNTAGVEMFAVGDKVAAFSMTKANRNGEGMPRWTQRRAAQYFNAVTVRYGTAGPRQVTFTATGTGAIASWTLDYTAMLSPDGVIQSRGLVTENGAEKTLSMTGGGGSYTYNATTNAITRAAGGAAVRPRHHPDLYGDVSPDGVCRGCDRDRGAWPVSGDARGAGHLRQGGSHHPGHGAHPPEHGGAERNFHVDARRALNCLAP